jgi:hypothetical protein
MMDNDLDTARGIVTARVISLCFWAAVVFAWWLW